ncbi:MAG: hypothetical protein ACYTAO_14830 [Planctomycetota bacterium]|jgi:hypothetical protein
MNHMSPIEYHHIDGSGKGETIAVSRSLGEKTKGFAGDSTTLKLGNKFYGK